MCPSLSTNAFHSSSVPGTHAMYQSPVEAVPLQLPEQR
ncbi:hypothetical protein PC116_g17508 [Phytophthora cactorum]|uniref:Uncharacterized protein n=1 Tax=Phytophthora cactorum TaxID=29920 RepID=A0A8T1DEW1_9STRA|nr:hypothetical protein PC117_g11105 [Phytophthora cactorum]KAG4052848.1 hypothetical protein PC123_g11989 [Phytophthora cactorum]KAG4234327.1 hypothetical protein PC116_g17508 [Phytophthora cactorum]